MSVELGYAWKPRRARQKPKKEYGGPRRTVGWMGIRLKECVCHLEQIRKSHEKRNERKEYASKARKVGQKPKKECDGPKKIVV